MTTLDCTAENCIYNKDRLCCKGDIYVEGRDAGRTEGTSCGSFVERNGSARNAVGTPSGKVDVNCEAVGCVFNQNEKCGANHIGISGPGASMSCQTECGSFQRSIG